MSSAKEERAQQLELHRMSRMNTEMIAKNAALEAECARLRAMAKQEAEKHAAKTEAMMKQHQAFQTAQHERMEDLKRERQAMTAQSEEMQQQMKKQNQQELSTQRQSNLVELVAMKRSLDARYAETIATKTAELEAARSALENALADEKKARVQREQEHMMHFLTRMEEFEKNKAVHLETAKQHFDAECKQRLEEQDQQEEQRRVQCARRMEELDQMEERRRVQCARRMEELDVHAAELKAERLQFEAVRVQRLDAEKQRQHELESQIYKYLSCVEELNKAKADAARQLETATRQLEEERAGLHATAKQALQSELDSQNSKHLARMEELNKAKADVAKQLETATRQLEEERTRLHAAAKQELQSELDYQNSKHLARMEELNKAKADAARQLETARREVEEERNGLLAAADQRFEAHVQKHAMKMMQTISFSHVSRAISANYAHMHLICHGLDFNKKRVLIYSHYSEREEVESYNHLMLEQMERRFDHVIVLTNCPNQWQFAKPDYNKFHVLCYNFKSDFRNYGVFIMQAGGQLKRASQVCIMNDSFLAVDVAAFNRCMQRMFAQACDFMGITSSYENVYHIQSYFMCFNNAATMGAVVDYFDAHGLPINHHAAISLYELGITQQLVNKGFVPFAAVSNKEMPIPLNTTHCKWSQVLQTTGIVKRQHFLKQYPARFAMTDLNIALVANKFSENKHFIHFLNYHGVKFD
jgi:myosin heavy subunit